MLPRETVDPLSAVVAAVGGATVGSGGAGGDNVYGTALCTLMMEVYYRYLKVADRDAGSLFDK